jgi:large subunit ribosomal protein L20
LSASVRAKGMSYSKFIHALSENDIALDRKVLSNIAIAFPAVFDKIFEKISK